MTDQSLVYKDQVFEHITNLAYNRNASSVGETKAITYIKDELEKAQLDTSIEHFEFSGARRMVMRIFYTLFISYLLIFRLFLVIITYYIIKTLFARTRRLTFIKKEESKNIYTLVSARNRSDLRPLVIFTAHYDSFTSMIPYRFQKVLFFIFRVIVVPVLGVQVIIASFLILDIVYYESFSQYIFNLIILSSIVQFIIIAIIVLLVYEINRSYGSIDNASGVSILIELAKEINGKPLENIDVLFLWTGAEEWGNKGAKHFYKEHKKDILRKYDIANSYNINIDMVGSYIGLVDKIGIIRKRKINENLNDLLSESAEELNIPLVKYSAQVEPRSEQRVFRKLKKVQKKFQIAFFHSAKDSKFIHSSQDSPDKCSAESLNGCLAICHKTLLKMDSNMDSN